MDRDTLFRGKRLDNGEWVEGCCTKTITGQAYIFRYQTITIGGYVEVDPSSVGRYTGKTVKTGKVFQDDIGKSIDGIFLVVWDDENAEFMMQFYDYPKERLYLEEMRDDAEIIANLHDNPELNDEEGGHHMKFRDPAERLTNNIFWFLWAFFIIDFLWQGLEMMFYGEIQPRKVDDVMALIWSAFVVLAYYRGRRHGEEDAE